MEGKRRTLKKMTGTTLALAIYFTFCTIVYFFAIIGVVMMRLINFHELELGAEEIEMLTEFITSLDIIEISIKLFAALMICVCMYQFKSKLKKGYLVPKLPYVGIIILQILNLCLKLISIELNLTSVVVNGGVAGLAGLAIDTLGKITIELDNEELALEL